MAEFSGSDRTVAEYLMAEMLDRQPPDVQRLLLRTSLLDRVNGELADLLTGAAGSERILLDLEDANAFVVSLDPARTWFRYHHMFSGLLRLELRRTTPADVPGLHRLAAGWFTEHADIAHAIRHLQAAGDWSEAARRLTDHAVSLTLDGQAGTVAALLRSFPARTGDDSPGLALVHAIADLDQLHLDRADAHLGMARAYAATTPPDRQFRLRMAIASLDLLSGGGLPGPPRIRRDRRLLRRGPAALCGRHRAGGPARLGRRGGAPEDSAEPAADELSPSELRVLRYLPTNLTRPEIAGQLSVSVNTVNTHIRRIYTKLGATDRSSAVRRGRELRLLSAGRT